MEVRKGFWKWTCAALLAGMAVLWVRHRSLTARVDALMEERKTYALKESRAFVVRDISEQMEEIAYQQKEISDRRREEAVRQMAIAEKMRLRAEQGENLAREEQLKAQRYAGHLEVARNAAEEERAKAVRLQHWAERARNEADTLSRLSLARSLASTSLVQYQLGNLELSGLLAYRAWELMSENRGDAFHPLVYDALSRNSESSLSIKIHKGGVARILPCPAPHEGFVSVTKYGEMSHWFRRDNHLEPTPLFSDSLLSFRDATFAGRDVLYALDFKGTLVVVRESGSVHRIAIPGEGGWMRVCPYSQDTLLLAAAGELCLMDREQEKIAVRIPLPQPLSALGRLEDSWMVFGTGGGCWQLRTDGRLEAFPLDTTVKGAVTASDWSPGRARLAVGTELGHIYLLDRQGRVAERLLGHRSKVTQLSFSPFHLFSSSYDGHLNIWNLASDKKEALSLRTVSSWIYCFLLLGNRSVWIGDAAGRVYRVLISPDDMARLVRRHLKRDFTDDEWNYYFGKEVPRRKLGNGESIR